MQKFNKRTESEVVELFAGCFDNYGMQSISYVYKNRYGLFIRMVVNSTSVTNKKVISDAKPFVEVLRNAIKKHTN